MRKIRIALCQIESHPALVTGTFDLLDEPFVGSGRTSLARIGTFGVDVDPLQQRCHHEYLAWAGARLSAIGEFLAPLQPDLVFFPELSIPNDHLPELADWSAAVGCAIFAGSHTPTRRSSARNRYHRIGVEDKDLNKLFKYGTINVLPIISSGKARLVPKRLYSPFEQLDIGLAEPALPAISPIRLKGRADVEILPLICSEALREHNITEQYELCGVISFERDPKRFVPFATQQARNKHPVIYCNDGAFGGSRIFLVDDARRPPGILDSLPDGLPPSDAILVIDLDLDAPAVEVGVAAPAVAAVLVRLAEVRAENDPAAEISKQFARCKSMSEPAAREAALRELLKDSRVTALQRLRGEFLAGVEAKGAPSDAYWQVLGEDCLIRGRPSLRTLESGLASVCVSGLTASVTGIVRAHQERAVEILAYISECQIRTTGPAQLGKDLALGERSSKATLDRDLEVRQVHEFLDSRAETLLEVTGLPEIGKSSTVEKALAQSGIRSTLVVALHESSSADFMVASLAEHIGSTLRPPYSDVVAAATSPELRRVLAAVSVLVIKGGQYLVTRNGTWKDEPIEPVLVAVLQHADECGAKIIVETQRELPWPEPIARGRRRLRIQGLDRARSEFGVALLESQLRRAGLGSGGLTEEHKQLLVSKLGGHPVAIALAADAVYELGPEAVVKSLKERRGSYFTFLRSLVAQLALTTEEEDVLYLLTLARGGVPREAVFAGVSFAAGPILRTLVELGLVDVAEDGTVSISTVVKELFEDAAGHAVKLKEFHASAALWFAEAAQKSRSGTASAVAAEYHAGLAGVDIGLTANLVDGALATATQLFQDQKYDEAAVILGPLVARRRQTDVLRLAAQVEARRNRFDTALLLAREVFSKDRRDVVLLSDLAKAALTQFRDDIAEELVETARSAGIEDVSILIVQARMLLRRDRLSDAESILKRACQITDRNPWPFYYLGSTYIRLGHLEPAIDTLQEGIEFVYRVEARSRNALNAMHTQLAYAYLLSDRVDLAEKLVEGLMESDPTPEAARVFAAVTIRKNQVQEAHKAFERLREGKLRTHRDRSQFHLLYGMFFLGIGDPHRASEEFQRAHEADRGNVLVLVKWARTLYSLGQERWTDGDPTWKQYLTDCAQLVRKILLFDRDNPDGLSLLDALHRHFSIDA